MSNVVIIRGTSGSGKTFIAQKILEQLGTATRTLPLGAKGKIGGYEWDPPESGPAPGHAIIGRYETACGGCDGLSWKGAADDIERLVNEMTDKGRHVLLEGLMVSTWGADRLLRIGERAAGGLIVLHLTTPLDVCLQSVQERRDERAAAKGKEREPLNPLNTTTKHRGLETHTTNQMKKGILVERWDRENALRRATELMGLGSQAKVPESMEIGSEPNTPGLIGLGSPANAG